jgi:hypothetical protein
MNYQRNAGTFNVKSDSVYLVGDFNGWGIGQPMINVDNSAYYETYVDSLIEGNTYNFKFSSSQTGNETAMRTIAIDQNISEFYDCYDQQCLTTDIAAVQITSPTVRIISRPIPL